MSKKISAEEVIKRLQEKNFGGTSPLNNKRNKSNESNKNNENKENNKSKRCLSGTTDNTSLADATYLSSSGNDSEGDYSSKSLGKDGWGEAPFPFSSGGELRGGIFRTGAEGNIEKLKFQLWDNEGKTRSCRWVGKIQVNDLYSNIDRFQVKFVNIKRWGTHLPPGSSLKYASAIYNRIHDKKCRVASLARITLKKGTPKVADQHAVLCFNSNGEPTRIEVYIDNEFYDIELTKSRWSGMDSKKGGQNVDYYGYWYASRNDFDEEDEV